MHTPSKTIKTQENNNETIKKARGGSQRVPSFLAGQASWQVGGTCWEPPCASNLPGSLAPVGGTSWSTVEQRPCPMTMAHGHGAWPWVMARGHGPWPMAVAQNNLSFCNNNAILKGSLREYRSKTFNLYQTNLEHGIEFVTK